MYAGRLPDNQSRRFRYMEDFEVRLGFGSAATDRRDALDDTHGDPDIAVVARNNACIVHLLGKSTKVNVGGIRGYLIPTSRNRSQFDKNGHTTCIRGWSSRRNVVFFVKGRFCHINVRYRDNVGCFL